MPKHSRLRERVGVNKGVYNDNFVVLIIRNNIVWC